MAVKSLPRFLFPEPLVTDFTLQNLPYGVFRPRGGAARIGVALGDKVVDLSVLASKGHLPSDAGLDADKLNPFMAKGKSVWDQVRGSLQELLSDDSSKSLSNHKDTLQSAIHAQADVEMLLPAQIGDYTDFYASREHASNVGKMFRPNGEPLMPNWLHLPVGYHGRSSTIVPSGTAIRWPCGQVLPNGEEMPVHMPSRMMDFELEMAAFIGGGNEMGEPIPIEKAGEHLFGMVILNDWSARDLQKWEYVPLGPFLGKSFGSTISPWVVPMAALERFRVPGPAQTDPKPMAYLQSGVSATALDVKLKVALAPSGSNVEEHLCESNLKYMYWSLEQMVAHHSVNGCQLRAGDLFGTGTISGPSKDAYGSMLELTWAGKEEVKLPKAGQTRKFLQAGDTVNMQAVAEKDGVRVGFGDCRGTLLPPRQ